MAIQETKYTLLYKNVKLKLFPSYKHEPMTKQQGPLDRKQIILIVTHVSQNKKNIVYVL